MPIDCCTSCGVLYRVHSWQSRISCRRMMELMRRLRAVMYIPRCSFEISPWSGLPRLAGRWNLLTCATGWHDQHLKEYCWRARRSMVCQRSRQFWNGVCLLHTNQEMLVTSYSHIETKNCYRNKKLFDLHC